MNEKKVPMRRCIGCQTVKEKQGLIRLVSDKQGVIHADPRGVMPGRGAYLCPTQECLKKALKSRALERTFKQKVTPENLDELTGDLESLQGDCLFQGGTDG